MVIKKDVKEVKGFKKFLELNSLLKIVSILFILSITVLAISYLFEGKKDANKEQNVITVSGHGEESVKPDTTTFTISVVESGKDVASAQAKATSVMNDAIATLKQNGIPDRNIKTLEYNTYPQYSSRTVSCATVPGVKETTTSSKTPTIAPSIAPAPATSVSVSRKAGMTTSGGSVGAGAVSSVGVIGAPNAVGGVGINGSAGCIDKSSVIIGYETSQSIEVKITDISKNPDLAGILSAAVGKLGVQTGGLTSFIDNPEKIKQDVRDQAIAKARVDAQNIAESLGVKLGKITGFSENSNGGYVFPMMMSAKSAVATDSIAPALPTGETKVTSDVSVTYSIK